MLVQRSSEISKVEEALASSNATRARIAVITGPPGVGKSALAREIGNRARARGVLVLWIPQPVFETPASNHAFQQLILDWLFQTRPREEFERALVMASRPELLRSQFLQGLQPPAGEYPRQLRDDHSMEKRAPAENETVWVASFLEFAARSRPVLGVLDNATVDKRGRIGLFDLLKKSNPRNALMLLATCLQFDGTQAQTVRLTNLDARGTSALLGLRGSEATPEIASQIHAETGGNPRLVARLAGVLGESHDKLRRGRPEWSTVLARAAERLGPLFRSRLSRLTEVHGEVILHAAVMGDCTDMNKLVAACPGPVRQQIADAVQMGRALGVFEPDTTGSGESVAFVSGLIRGAVLAAAPNAQIESFHRNIARRLEQSYDCRAPAMANEIANHYARSWDVEDISRAAELLLRAAREAERRRDWQVARQLFERVLSEFEERLTEDTRETARMGVATSLLREGEKFVALTFLRSAFSHFHRKLDLQKLIEISLLPASLECGDDEYLGFIARTLSLLPDSSPKFGLLLHAYGTALVKVCGNYTGAWLVFGDLLYRATLTNDEPTRCSALRALASLDNRFDRPEIAERKSGRTIAQSSDPASLSDAERTLSESKLLQNDRLGAARHAARALAEAERCRDRTLAEDACILVASLNIRSAEWESATTFLEKAMGRDPRSTRLLAMRASVEYHQGNIAVGDDFFERLLALLRSYPKGPFLAYASAAQLSVSRWRVTGEDLDLSLVREVAALLDTDTTPHAVRIPLLLSAGLLAGKSYDYTQAARVHERLCTVERYNLDSDYSFEHVLALLSLVLDDFEAAVRRFRSSLRQLEVTRDLPSSAWLLYDYGTALQEKGESTGGVVALRRAADIAERARMRPLVQRVNERLDERDRRQAAVSQPQLSRRELQLLPFLAEGLSNKTIASVLGISTFTVQNHVRNTFRKLRVNNRVTAVHAARELGLL